MKYFLWIILFILIFIIGYSSIAIVLYSHASISFYEQVPYIINVGYIGDFISGVTSFLSLILTIVAISYVRKTYNRDKKTDAQNNFENKFFSLINNILAIKSKINKDDLREIIEK